MIPEDADAFYFDKPVILTRNQDGASELEIVGFVYQDVYNEGAKPETCRDSWCLIYKLSIDPNFDPRQLKKLSIVFEFPWGEGFREEKPIRPSDWKWDFENSQFYVIYDESEQGWPTDLHHYKVVRTLNDIAKVAHVNTAEAVSLRDDLTFVSNRRNVDQHVVEETWTRRYELSSEWIKRERLCHTVSVLGLEPKMEPGVNMKPEERLRIRYAGGIDDKPLRHRL